MFPLKNLARKGLRTASQAWRATSQSEAMFEKSFLKEKNHYVDFLSNRGGRLNIKMSSYQYRDPHVKDKTVSRPSNL